MSAGAASIPSQPAHDLPPAEALLAVADLLAATGMSASALRTLDLATNAGAVPDEATARRRRIEDARLADTALTAMRLPASEFAVPSMDRHANGTPRFVLPIPVAAAGQAEVLQLVSDEVAGDGVSAALRLFLSAMLEPGDAFVDADPGFGLALLTAASRHADVSVVTRAADSDHAAFLARALECNGIVQAGVQVPTPGGAIPMDALTAHPVARRATRVIVHAGRADDVAMAPSSLDALLRDPRVAAVAWTRSSAQGDAAVRDRAGATGAGHFVLAQDAQGAVLVPAEQLPDAALVVTVPARVLQERLAA
jgi:hypothetical protein